MEIEKCVICGNELSDKQLYERKRKGERKGRPFCSNSCVTKYMVSKQTRKGLKKRFYKDKFIIKDNGCWEWTANIAPSTGYGLIMTDSQGSIGAHRASYIIHKGPIPEGYHIHHVCKNKKCVNPEHLEAMESFEHLSLESKSRAKEYCGKGHKMEGENIYYKPNGKRECRQCRKESRRKYWLKNAK